MKTQKQILEGIINNEYDFYTPNKTGYTDLQNDIFGCLKTTNTIPVFIITMPNVGSWNGKWTGANNLYCCFRKLGKKWTEKLLEGQESKSWYYNFGDGWGANVELKLVSGTESRKMKKISKGKGFMGYEWMIDSILNCGEIKTSK